MSIDTDRSILGRFILLLGDFRDGEFKRAMGLHVQFSVIIFVLVLGRTVRDALFLSRSGVEALPLMYVGVAVVTTAATLVYTRVIHTFEPARAAPAVQTFFAVSFGLLAIFANTGGTVFYATLYLWVEVLTAITVIQFWNVANAQFDPRQAKRLYGFIAAGQAAGNLLCGVLATGAGKWIGVDDLLWIVSAGCLIAGLMYLNAEKAKKSDADETGFAARPTPRIRDEKEFKQYIYIIVFLVAATYIATSWVDFQFKVIARRTLEEEALTQFFGQFYGAVGIVSFIAQLLLLRHITRFMGLFGALALMPLLFIGIGGFLPLFPLLLVATALKFSESSLRYAIYDPLLQTVYLPLPAAVRARVQPIASGVVKPAAIGAAGLLLMPLAPDQPGGMPAQWIGVAVAALSIVVVMLLLKLRRGYLAVLVEETAETAETRSLDPIIVADKPTLDRLMALASEGEARSVSWFLDRIEIADVENGLRILAMACTRRDLPMTLRTRLAARYQELGGDIHRLVEGDDPQDCELMVTLSRTSKREDWRRMIGPIEDGSQDVREAALMHLAASGVPEAVLQARDYLLIFATSRSPGDRILACELAEFLLPSEQEQLVSKLLAENDIAVKNAGLRFLSKKPIEVFLPRIVQSLNDSAIHVSAAHALARAGDAGFQSLECHQDETDTSKFPWRRLGSMWNAYAMEANLEWCELAAKVVIVEPDPQYWLPALLAVASRADGPPRSDPKLLLNRAISTAESWLSLCRLLTKQADSDPTAIDSILIKGASTRFDAAVHAAVAIVFLFNPPPIKRWDRLLRTGLFFDSKLRANLAEIVDQSVDSTEKNHVIDLLELHLFPDPDPATYQEAASPLPQLAAMRWPDQNQPTESTMSKNVDKELLINRLLFLSSVPLLKSLGGEDLERIAEVLDEIHYAPDTTFIRQGERGDSLYLITKGKVGVFAGETKVAELEQGTVVGEIALLDQQPRAASVVSIGDVEVLRLHSADFDRLLSAYPQIARGVMNVLTERVRNLTEQIQQMECKS